MTGTERIVFGIVAKVLGIKIEEINSQTLIPSELQTEVIERTSAATRLVLLFNNRKNLKAGNVVEEVNKRWGD